MDSEDAAAREALFWDLAEEMYADPAVERSTMMGYPCLRRDGQFFASIEKGTSRLIVKVPEARVAELIGAGTGEAFAPAGRVFREWVAIPTGHEKTWRSLLAEAKAFVG